MADAQAAVAQAMRGGAGAGRAGGVAPDRRRRGAAAAPRRTSRRVQKSTASCRRRSRPTRRSTTSCSARSPTKFADLKARAEKGEALPPFTLPNVKVTVNVDNTYDVVSTQLTKNVVGMVEGSDPKLKDTYVLFGAHLDHVGYRDRAAGRRQSCAARQPPATPDLIFNGADDDGSGSTALLGIAKAFATGPKPKRSVVFVWHTGEESGLLGSRYMADFPVVPLEKVQAQFNIDMIGRNRDDDPAQANTVFVIGADRISTDLHNLVVETNNGARQAADARLRVQRPGRPEQLLHPQRPLQLRGQGHPDRVLLHGHAPRLPRATPTPSDKILYPEADARSPRWSTRSGSASPTPSGPERDNKGPRSGPGVLGPDRQDRATPV